MKKLNWGIIGTGNIAKTFATALNSFECNNFYGAFGRSVEKADKFNENLKATKRFQSLDELLNSSEIDVIYIATPHSEHCEMAKLAFAHNKHVLCEKAVTVNSRELRELIEIASTKKLFFMEAMWSRFLPITNKLKELIAEKVIGEVRYFYGIFAFLSSVNEDSRLFANRLAGGALLDIGVYPIHYGQFLFGKGKLVGATGKIGTTHVDVQNSALILYDNGVIGNHLSSLECHGNDVRLIGSNGEIVINNFWCATKMTIKRQSQADEVIEIPHRCNGYEYEIDEVYECITNNKIQSEKLPWHDSLEVMEIMDEIRNNLKVSYKNDKLIL